MITNANRNHPAVLVVAASPDSDSNSHHIAIADHAPHTPIPAFNDALVRENASLHKAAVSSSVTSSNMKDTITADHVDDDDYVVSAVGETKESTVPQQYEQHEEDQENQSPSPHEMLQDTSEQSNASSVTSMISVLTPQGAAMRQQQHDVNNVQGDEGPTVPPQPLLPQQQQEKQQSPLHDSSSSAVINQQLCRILPSLTRSMLLTIRESASITTASSTNIKSPQPQPSHIMMQSIPLFQSVRSPTLLFQPSTVSGNYTAVQQLYLDLQHHDHNFMMLGSTTMSNRSNGNMDSTSNIVDQWMTTVCNAIMMPDVNAVVTQALLAALYTLIETDDTDAFLERHSEQIINAIIHCAFEESNTTSLSIDNNTIHSNNSQRNAVADENDKKNSTSAGAPTSLPMAPIGTSSTRRRASTMSIPATSTAVNNEKETTQVAVRKLPPRQSSFHDSKTSFGSSINQTSATTADDELAVYQLLRLTLLLVEKWRPQQGMDQQLIGLLDLCWHVHSMTQQILATSRTLQQNAMDAELHIIRSILLRHSFETITMVLGHVLNRVSKYLQSTIQAKSPVSSASPSSTNSDVTCIESSSVPHSQMRIGGAHSAIHTDSCLISTTHCLALIKVISPWIRMNAHSIEVSLVDLVLGPIIQDIISLTIDTNSTTILHGFIEVVDEYVAIFGLARLKCEYEVFLHTVILRRLVCSETSIAEKEIVMKYLEQICLATHTISASVSINIIDLYINYDCDCSCTNLFETMMSSLSNVANPANWTTVDMKKTISLSYANNIDPDKSSCSNSKMSAIGEMQTTAPNKLSLVKVTNHLQRMALNCILSTLESAEQIGNQENFIVSTGPSCTDTVVCNEFMIHSKKAKKLSLDRVVHSFNTTNPDKGEWLNVALKEGVLGSTNDPAAVAELLYMGPMNLDKQRVGIYLSRGPESDFPFHASLRTHFVTLFDFRNLSFSLSLRKFLSKFRLPGEAQCIDRLMEVFSKEFFQQHQASTIFHNADAVYVLAFSTILLNTDLHNPTIKADRRMTLEQFLANNRGINGGEDLPCDFLSDLYEQIKERELQLLTELDQFTSNTGNDGNTKMFWDAVNDQKGVVDEAIRLSEDIHQYGCKLLSKDLLAATKFPYISALAGIFVTSDDNIVIARVLRAMKQLLKLVSDSEMDCTVNNVLQMFLAVGQDYISKHGSDDGSTPGTLNLRCPSSDHSRRKRNPSIDSTSLSEDILLGIESNQIPFSLLCSSTDVGESDDFVGCSEHRGLLALDFCFDFIKNNTSRVNKAWPTFVKSLCMLRDIRALPKSLSDLDDFADSSGHVLPLSSFALGSQKRFQDHHRAMNDKENPKQKGWFRSLFRKSKIDDQVSDTEFVVSSETDLSASAKALLEIVQASDVESIVQMGSSKIPEESIGALLDILDLYPFEHDPVAEQHAIFTVELAARALLSHHERAEALFLMFLSKFEKILCKATNVDGDTPDAPFIVERIVVTILRSCIHLYEFPKLRPHLRASLQLLTMTLPRSFIHVIANRMACGLAIILRASYQFFEDQQEWSFMNDMLDALAHYETSRVFVFDGIASTVEYAMPNFNPNSNVPSSLCFRTADSSTSSFTECDEDELRRIPPSLSVEACNVLSRILIRFVLNYYHGDQSLMVPAMLCLEKVYRRKVEILLTPQHTHAQLVAGSDESMNKAKIITPLAHTSIDVVSNAPDPELWQNVAVAIYSVCRSPDPDASTIATKCFRRIVVRTNIDQIDHSVWVTMLFLMVHKQPTTQSEVSRANTFSVLGQLLLRIVPSLSHCAAYREDIEELVVQFSALAEENIQSSISSQKYRDHNDHSHYRRAGLSTNIMFDKTVQMLTYICNHILSDSWNGDRAFSVWMNDALLNPLEMASNISHSQGQGKVVVTAIVKEDELDDVSEISDSVAGEEYY